MSKISTIFQRLESIPKQRELTALMISAGVLLLSASGWYWWQKVYTSPHDVFWSMINQSLSSASVTRSSSDPSQVRTMNLTNRMQFNDDLRVLTKTELIQSGSTVTTESLLTPTENYVRYVSVNKTEVPEGEIAEEVPDFSTVVGQWARIDNQGDTSGNQSQLMESYFGPVLLGNFTGTQRRALVRMLQDNKAYEVDYDSTKRIKEDGRDRLVYNAKLHPKGYVTTIIEYYKYLGLNNQYLDPGQYENAQPVDVEITVDLHSRQMTKFMYAGEGARGEHFSGYGRQAPIAIPKDSISGEDLQNRLNEIGR